MSALALACGNVGDVTGSPMLAERSGLEVLAVPATPGKEALAPVLADLGERRLVVIGSDADLAAVALRLLRGERLAEIVLGYVPATGTSEVAVNWGIPLDTGRALDVALGGDADPMPLIRDDVGGVLLGMGILGPVRGVAYCDDVQVLRGYSGRIEVRPHTPGAGLSVRVIHTGLLGKRVRQASGRAFQIGCVPTKPLSDGVRYPRTVNRWTWYRHTENLRLVRGI
ncbi:MAG: hypothetical protein ACRDRN_00985 [Sciscionella sp.]